MKTARTRMRSRYMGLALGALLVSLRPAVAMCQDIAQSKGCPTGKVCITTYMYQNQRAGLNQIEGTLTSSALTGGNFHLKFTETVDEAIYAEPLYLPNVIVNGLQHNVVFVATENNSVYAFDADAGGAALWGPITLDHGGTGRPVVENVDLSSACANFYPNFKIGITGTPVIDISANTGTTVTTGTLYVVAAFAIGTPATSFAQTLYALNITTGNIVAQLDISATVSGLTFGPQWQSQRGALLFQGGKVYIPWGSHCDQSSWAGWLISYSLSGSTLTRSAAWVTTPVADTSGTHHGGIWQSGNGAAGDGTNIFLATGNGSYNIQSNSGPPLSYHACTPTPPATLCDYSDSLVKLNGNLSVLDFFTPGDQANRNTSTHDYDLGSGGVVVVPTQSGGNPTSLLVQSGKEGDIYLVNRAPGLMGGYSGISTPPTDYMTFAIYGRNAVGSGLCIVYNSSNECGMWSSPAWWNIGHGSSPYTSYAYFGPFGGAIQQYKICPGNSGSNGCSGTATVAYNNHSSTNTFGYPGTTTVITSASQGSSSAVLWALDNSAFTNTPTGWAVLYAYDANNLGTALWNSNGTLGDHPGVAVKFTVPTVAGGKVYVGGASQLTVYGLP